MEVTSRMQWTEQRTHAWFNWVQHVFGNGYRTVSIAPNKTGEVVITYDTTNNQVLIDVVADDDSYCGTQFNFGYWDGIVTS